MNLNLSDVQRDVRAVLQEAKHTFFDSVSDFDTLDFKGLNQLVTNTDVATEAFLVEHLKRIVPASSILAEEETEQRKKAEFEWIIDPLDGTTNYVHQIPVYSISVALQHRGATIAGFVHELNRDELFWATADHAAHCNQSEIRVNSDRVTADSLVATGFPYFEFDEVAAYLEVLTYAMKSTRGVRRLGSAAVDLAYVACGRFDVFFEYGLNPWDVAAGAYIVERAGGKVSDFSGGSNAIFGKQILAGAPLVYQDFLVEVGKMA